MLISKSLGGNFSQKLKTGLIEHGVEIIDNPDERIWEEEFLDMKIVVEPVDDMGKAIDMINRYSGQHSATIVTNNAEEAAQFLDEVDCAAVYHNASTRFTDGFQFGLGAEMAISTQKLHARGPMALPELTSYKWIVRGDGQVREAS